MRVRTCRSPPPLADARRRSPTLVTPKNTRPRRGDGSSGGDSGGGDGGDARRTNRETTCCARRRRGVWRSIGRRLRWRARARIIAWERCHLARATTVAAALGGRRRVSRLASVSIVQLAGRPHRRLRYSAITIKMRSRSPSRLATSAAATEV